MEKYHGPFYLMTGSTGTWLFIGILVICQLQGAEEFKQFNKDCIPWRQSCPETQWVAKVLTLISISTETWFLSEFISLEGTQQDYLTFFTCGGEQGFIIIHPCLVRADIKDEHNFAKGLLE